ncbi:MAG: hypothetical protein QOE03_3637 [Micromonosporaceae bacterium]|nr:hypothetical protein [Micromonosporaceae bacterium]
MIAAGGLPGMTTTDWPTQVIPAYATTADWRRICLDRQLPKPRFPAGVRVPAIVCLIGVAVLSVLTMAFEVPPGRQTVPEAVLSSQRQVVVSVAHSVEVATRQELDDLAGLAAGYQRDAAHDPNALVTAAAQTRRWRGTAVLSAPDRRVVGAQGDPVPPERVSAVTSAARRSIFVTPDGVRSIVAVPLSDGRVLAAMSAVVLRSLRLEPTSKQAILVATGNEIVQSQGVSGGGAAALSTVRDAVRGARRHDTASVVGPVGPAPAGTAAGTAPAASAARVGDLDLFVVSVVQAPTSDDGSRWAGIPLTGALLLIGLGAFALLWVVLVRPIQRLLGHAKAVACGGLGRHGRPTRVSELRRIAVALDGSRATIHQRPGRGDDNARRAMPAVVAVVGATAAIAAWSAAVVVVHSGAVVDLPTQIAADTQNRVEAVATSVRGVLDQGLSQLSELVRVNGSRTTAEVRAVLRRTVEEGPRYRSLYVADADGTALIAAGRRPLREPRRFVDRDGVYLDRTAGRVPAIFVQVKLTGGRELVGEFDLDNLTSVLRRVEGRVRVITDDMQIVLDTGGYRAFAKVSSGALLRSARGAVDGRSGALLDRVQGVRSVVAAAPLRAQDSSLGLRWAVVADRSVGEFSLPVNEIRRHAWMVAICGLCLALLLLGWLHFVVLRPLRSLAVAADRLADGDLTTIISPARHDEIGALGVCLDVCRQAQVYGNERLAGAPRLRGAGRDRTLVLPRIPAQATGGRQPSPRRR